MTRLGTQQDPREPQPLPAVPEAKPAEAAGSTPELSAAQLAELNDEARQAEYQRQFRLQIQRRGCAGCGE